MSPDDDEEASATVVAQIPRELLRKGAGAEKAPARSSGGGLGQMFARSDSEAGSLRAPRPAAGTAAERSEEDATARPRERPHGDAPPSSTAATPDPSGSSPSGRRRSLHEREGARAPHVARLERRAASRARGPARSGRGARRRRDVRSVRGAGPVPVPRAHPRDPGHRRHAGSGRRGHRRRRCDGAQSRRDAGSEPPSTSRRARRSIQPARRAFDPDTDTSVHLKGAIHSPSQREYDPNEETSILSKAAFRAHLAEPPDDEGEDPTRFRSRGEAVAPHKQTQSWQDERPAHERLSPAMRASFAARAEWLEAEARAAEDRATRARVLLTASELRAMLGEIEAAEILAREAAATAPSLTMAPRQARALARSPREAGPLAEALDAEGRQSPTRAARLHGALLAADVLRLSGDADGAAKRWDQAVRIVPGDPRAPLARAADRLARGDAMHLSLRLPDASELAPLAEAVARALKIRGVVRPDVDTDEPLPNDAMRRAREAIDAGDLGAAAATAIAELARVPELRDAASWLAASLATVDARARAESVDWLRIVAKSAAARRALAARALELGAAEVLEEAITARGASEAFSASDRAVLAFLGSVPHASSDEDLDVLGDSDPRCARSRRRSRRWGHRSGGPSGSRERGARATRSVSPG